MMEYLPREDGFPEGEVRGKTILPRETFHHGIPTGMSYLYNSYSLLVSGTGVQWENTDQPPSLITFPFVSSSIQTGST